MRNAFPTIRPAGTAPKKRLSRLDERIVTEHEIGVLGDRVLARRKAVQSNEAVLINHHGMSFLLDQGLEESGAGGRQCNGLACTRKDDAPGRCRVVQFRESQW